MSNMHQFDKMKPVIIIPPDTISDDDIKLLRENNLCVVVAQDPSAVKFLDPIPAQLQRTKIEQAAIMFSRKLLARGTYDGQTRANFTAMFFDLLVAGTPLDPEPSQEEKEKAEFRSAKYEEIRRLAREEAKAERAKAKTSAQK